MRTAIVTVSLLFFTLLAAQTTPAEARKYRFGDESKVHVIQDVDVKGAKGEPLVLGYLTTTKNFILPYMMTDNGHVLGVKGGDGYYELKPEKITELQASGVLPKPLPAYKISMVDWAFGFLLPLVAVGLILFYGLKRMMFGRSREPEEA